MPVCCSCGEKEVQFDNDLCNSCYASVFVLPNEAEKERLAMLAEECAEVIQVVAKILRHGFSSYHPAKPSKSNRAHLMDEINDLTAIIDQMNRKRDIITINTGSEGAASIWRKKLLYTHFQEDVK